VLKATTHKKGCVGVSGKQGESGQVKQSGFDRLSQGLLALKFARGKAIDKPCGAWVCEREANAVKQ